MADIADIDTINPRSCWYWYLEFELWIWVK